MRKLVACMADGTTVIAGTVSSIARVWAVDNINASSESGIALQHVAATRSASASVELPLLGRRRDARELRETVGAAGF